MEALAITLTIAAAVTPAAALVIRAISRLPILPLVEASVIAILIAVAGITIAELRGQPLPAWAIALSMVAWLWFLLIFPSGRPTSPPLAAVASVATLIIAAGQFTDLLQYWASVAFVVAFTAMCAGQVWRYVRRSSIPERQSTKWLVLGLLPAIGIFLGVGILSLLPSAGPTMLEQSWYLIASTGAMWIVPIAASAGILLGDRGPIDELIRYGIAVTGTALVAAATYIVVLGVAGTAWAAAAACVIVLPSCALFLRIGTALAYSRGPQRPLAALPVRLASSPDPRHVADAVAMTIRESLGIGGRSLHDLVALGMQPREPLPIRDTAGDSRVRAGPVLGAPVGTVDGLDLLLEGQSAGRDAGGVSLIPGDGVALRVHAGVADLDLAVNNRHPVRLLDLLRMACSHLAVDPHRGEVVEVLDESDDLAGPLGSSVSDDLRAGSVDVVRAGSKLIGHASHIPGGRQTKPYTY
ncbi:hypothetical protein [Microbacterium lacticum]